ncbi:MAG: hypothetical protein ACUZ8H_16095 [Candidatus Anammoxibacter sp.]
MENSKIQKELSHVIDSMSRFSDFANGMLDDAIKDAPKSEKAELKRRIKKMKKEGLGDINQKLRDAQNALNDLL